MPTAISKDSFSRPARRQYCYRSTSTTSSPKSVSFASPPSLQTATTPRLPAPPQTLDDAVAHVFNTLYPLHANPSPTRAPIIIRDVSPKVWELFRRKHADHSAFKSSKFEYDDSRMKIIAYPLAKPLHDFANKVMTKHIYLGMSAARLDSQKRVGSLLIDRENFEKLSATGSTNQREPDSALWTPAYHSGVVPTIVWEIGHLQKRASLHRRAKMWCRRYDGQVHVVILVKYLRKDPRRDNSSILEVYRPAWCSPRTADSPPRWTARKEGRTYTLFPRPPEAVLEVYDNPDDAVPLTYRDYFGEGNVGPAAIDPTTRFDLPLELVREMIEIVVPVTAKRERYRFASGGSSVGGGDVEGGGLEAAEEDGIAEPDVAHEANDEKVMDVEMMEYEEVDDRNWDAALSDVSDSDG